MGGNAPEGVGAGAHFCLVFFINSVPAYRVYCYVVLPKIFINSIQACLHKIIFCAGGAVRCCNASLFIDVTAIKTFRGIGCGGVRRNGAEQLAEFVITRVYIVFVEKIFD